MSRGQTYAMKGQYDRAIKDFEKTLSMDLNEESKEFAKNMLRQLRGH